MLKLKNNKADKTKDTLKIYLAEWNAKISSQSSFQKAQQEVKSVLLMNKWQTTREIAAKCETTSKYTTIAQAIYRLVAIGEIRRKEFKGKRTGNDLYLYAR